MKQNYFKFLFMLLTFNMVSLFLRVATEVMLALICEGNQEKKPSN